jgi:mRNA-degrading endonuclease RelE of RelBE toxin-antitoxin system
MFTVEYGSAVKKDLKKLPKNILTKIEQAFSIIASDPYKSGEKLSGGLAGFFSFHFKITKIEYRIIYEILPNNQIIFILIIGTRENMYDKLKRRV